MQLTTETGERMTIEQPITARMAALVQEWQARDDRRAIFLQCYRLMTLNMLTAIDTGEFQDAGWVSRLLRRFAGYYFDALELYERSHRRTPLVWLATHDAAARSETMMMQNLLLGVNAHINYDLVLTLVEMLEGEWGELGKRGRRRRYTDHCRVNVIIGATIDSVQDAVLEPRMPAMDLVDKAMGPVDEWMTSWLITHWREEVWQNAVALMEARDKKGRERLQRSVEAVALKRAEVLLLKGFPLALKHLV
jgi:hypothetical protein